MHNKREKNRNKKIQAAIKMHIQYIFALFIYYCALFYKESNFIHIKNAGISFSFDFWFIGGLPIWIIYIAWFGYWKKEKERKKERNFFYRKQFVTDSKNAKYILKEKNAFWTIIERLVVAGVFVILISLVQEKNLINHIANEIIEYHNKKTNLFDILNAYAVIIAVYPIVLNHANEMRFFTNGKETPIIITYKYCIMISFFSIIILGILFRLNLKNKTSQIIEYIGKSTITAAALCLSLCVLIMLAGIIVCNVDYDKKIVKKMDRAFPNIYVPNIKSSACEIARIFDEMNRLLEKSYKKMKTVKIENIEAVYWKNSLEKNEDNIRINKDEMKKLCIIWGVILCFLYFVIVSNYWSSIQGVYVMILFLAIGYIMDIKTVKFLEDEYKSKFFQKLYRDSWGYYLYMDKCIIYKTSYNKVWKIRRKYVKYANSLIEIRKIASFVNCASKLTYLNYTEEKKREKILEGFITFIRDKMNVTEVNEMICIPLLISGFILDEKDNIAMQEIVSEIVEDEHVEIITQIYAAVLRDLYGNDYEYNKSNCYNYLMKYDKFKNKM